MTIDEILDYVMQTPENTNRAILKDMLNQLDTGGGDSIPTSLEWHFTEKQTGKYDHTWESDRSILELIDVLAGGGTITLIFTRIVKYSTIDETTVETYDDVRLDQYIPYYFAYDNYGQIATNTNDGMGPEFLNSKDKFYIYYD